MILILFIRFSLFFANAQAPVHTHPGYSCTDEDVQIAENYFRLMASQRTKPFGELVIETALFFINTPYAASTLEQPQEHPVINLRELDCTTFVENVIALVYTVKQREVPSFELYCSCLSRLRYRTGNVFDYTDRLHYFSDWIYENEKRGFVHDMTGQTGGEPCFLELSFMSAHPEKYMQLEGHPERIKKIQSIEREISARDVYAMIPKEKINACTRDMKNGDIVCFVTNIKGLDVTHTGFVYKKDNVSGLIHASSAAGKVIVDPKPLHTYAENVKSTVGIMVIRPGSNNL
ncbi:MAG: DUF1460 domain-containing protein [Tannerella sp.]|jgi:hypothetical protein|nr:DUF1460 domain-containing protein [Tannerella sp.]